MTLRAIPFGQPGDVKLLSLDVDGVLTDGSVTHHSGGAESKTFSTRDGFGIRLWLEAGFDVCIITGRGGEAVRTRCKELGIEHLVEGSKDKAAELLDLCAKVGLGPESAAHVGDDWPDLAAMHQVAYPVAVADAEQAVKDASAWTTSRTGGHGAVRETVEHLLEAHGLLEIARKKYGAG